MQNHGTTSRRSGTIHETSTNKPPSKALIRSIAALTRAERAVVWVYLLLLRESRAKAKAFLASARA
jgi:hypothetical protein